jgi:hypothetical protein
VVRFGIPVPDKQVFALFEYHLRGSFNKDAKSDFIQLVHSGHSLSEGREWDYFLDLRMLEK